MVTSSTSYKRPQLLKSMPPFALIRRTILLSFIAGSAIIESTRTPQSIDLEGIHEHNVLESSLKGAKDLPPRNHLRRHETNSMVGATSPQFGLVVAHCHEEFLTWVDDVDTLTITDAEGRQQETTWDAVVYERCGKTASEKYSKWQRNLGSEECTGYLQYIVDRYDNLPEIVYFLQPDALGFNDVQGHEGHTDFASLQELVAASAPLMLENSATSNKSSNMAKGFLSLGKGTIDEAALVPRERPGHDITNMPVEVIKMMKERAPAHDEDSLLSLVPGACFAVRRERILANPAEFYKDLILDIASRENEQWTCFALEATWHVVFGEGLAMPPTSSVTYLRREGMFA